MQVCKLYFKYFLVRLTVAVWE